MSQSVDVCIDTREDRDYRKTFANHEQVNSIDVRQLETGDFEVTPKGGGDRVLFERKTPGDFVGSMKNRRLETQITKMYEEVSPEKAYIVIEGDMSDFEYMPYTQTTQNSVHGFIGSVSARWQCVPLFCSDKIKLTDMVVRVSRKCFEDTVRLVRKPQGSPSKANYTFYDKALLQLEGISRKRKDRIKKEFPSMPDLVNATPQDLQQIDGIGTKTAQSIIEQVNNGKSVDA